MGGPGSGRKKGGGSGKQKPGNYKGYKITKSGKKIWSESEVNKSSSNFLKRAKKAQKKGINY